MSNDKNNLTNATMPNVPEYRRNILTPALEAVFGTNKDGNGSPMGGALIPILLIGVALIVYFIMRSRSGGSPFDQLKPNSQNAVNNFLQFQNMIQFTLDNNPVQFTVSHCLLNNLQSGILLTNATQNIYITYYEYLNWYNNANTTLSIPVRTLANNTLTDSTTAGYSLYYDTVADVLKITSLTAATASAATYTDTNNVVQTVATTSEPNIQNTTAGTTAYTEFLAKSSLSQSDLVDLSGLQGAFSVVPFLYNSGTEASPNATDIPLQFSELTINGTQCGYQFVSSDQSIKIYMTYRELINIMNIFDPLRLPLRSIVNDTVVNDLSDGYTITLSAPTAPSTGNPMPGSVKFYKLATIPTKVPASYIRTKNVASDSRGPNYGFYITYDMLGIDHQTIVNTFIGRQDLIQYNYNNSAITLTAAHLSLNNVQVGVSLSNTAANLTIYLSYNEILTWLLSDFTSPGANAIITVPQRSLNSIASPQVAIDSATNAYTLAFDPNNNAKINITAGPITSNNLLVQYNDTTQTPARTVIIDANTGWTLNTGGTTTGGGTDTGGGTGTGSGTGGGTTTGGGIDTGGGTGTNIDTGFGPQNSLGLSSDELIGLSALSGFLATIAFFYNSGTQASPNSIDIALQFSELTINGIKSGYQFVSSDQSVQIYIGYKEFLTTNPDKLQIPLRSIVNNVVVNDFSNGYVLVTYPPTGPTDSGSIKFYKLST